MSKRGRPQTGPDPIDRTLAIRIPRELLEALRERAATEGCSVGALVRRGIVRVLED